MAIDLSSLTLPKLRARWFSRADSDGDRLLPGPIRGDLLGPEQLAEHAHKLAGSQQIAPESVRRRRVPLLERLDETRRILHDARERLAEAAVREADIGSGGEWLLDNFYVIQEHLLEVRESMPRRYYRELPELAPGAPLAGYPRVYQIAIELIAHSEGRIDADNLDLFIGAFQRDAPLSLGELWAIPAMLRLGLLESVRRMTLRTLQRLDQLETADRAAREMLAAAEEGSAALARELRRFVNDPPDLTAVFISRFLQRISLSQAAFTPLVWLEQWIAEDALSGDDAMVSATQRVALTQLMMGNSITSLRALARIDWKAFVEHQSVVERILVEGDPSGMYSQMTFATRDRYRHVIEAIARRTRQPEKSIAAQAVALAEASFRERPNEERRAHIGFYLADEGVHALRQAAGYRESLLEALYSSILRHAYISFFAPLVAATVVSLAGLLWLAGAGTRQGWPIVLVLALIPASEIALSLVNQLVTLVVRPRVLPKLDLSGENGIPAGYRTAVVVPTLLASTDDVRDALEHLEVQFLANRTANLHFAILSDFTDSATENRDGDPDIVAAAVAGVEALNAKYAGSAPDMFYLFHRSRRWNEKQGVWMGWERKRGKLAEFNRVLRGEAGALDAFSTVVGDMEVIRTVRFVITLDSDTILPPDAAARLAGTLAHPLNRPVFDPAAGRVVRGYGILQPRVGVVLPSAHRSRFAAIHSGHPGVDPYTTAVSDVYQDLCGEGSFTGKGIYDVGAFEAATHGRFPENTLLSHDLIEGNYARAGLVTDLEVYDEYPSRYLTFTRRKHRWMRGDWQLLQWLTDRTPGPDGLEQNRLPPLARWKIFDNLRRSLVEVSQLSLLVTGWILFPESTLRWTIIVLLVIAAPWLISASVAAMRVPRDKSWRAYYSAVGRDAVTSIKQFGLSVTFLPHQAWIAVDAIARTLWRLLVSRRNLLEWQTASQTERAASGATHTVWQVMWPAVAVAIVTLSLVLAAPLAVDSSGQAGGPPWVQGLVIAPLILLWGVSPAIAEALSAPAVRRERRLPPELRASAMRYALLHWRYFDRFVTAKTNWLVPDNFQEEPVPVIAMRTSPTNIGLQLLSTVSAYDLGFITVARMIDRLELAFRSLERLRRFRGHFYNWYSLHDLHVLEPAYVSTVDSGNLAGHLIAFRQACSAIMGAPAFDDRSTRALQVALSVAYEQLLAADHPTAKFAAERIRTAREQMSSGAPGETLDRVAGAISAVREYLDANGVRAEEENPVVDWVAWCADLAESHRAVLAEYRSFGAIPVERHARLPSILDLAARSTTASEWAARLDALAERAYALAIDMDFRFLFDERRKLFTVGYHTKSYTPDSSSYDLLASEVRLASFVAIAKKDVPVDHWFRLGRTLTSAPGGTIMISWSGSVFEYLMPLLVMRSFPHTLLDQTYGGAIRRHVSYAAELGVPWGMSESAYNLRDRHKTYQYRAFGVPDLALKRGLGRELVIAPYASALAAMITPHEALANLSVLAELGALGHYGFRDAVDYSRPAPGEQYAVVRTFMAHHIGMSLVALTNALTDQPWQKRFHSDPIVRSTELLLHERIPRSLVLQEPQAVSVEEPVSRLEREQPAVRQVERPDTAQPRVALLGHMPYTIMITSGGSGYSHFENLAVTRWRADGTRDDTGQYCYIKDVTTGRVWSAAHQPTGADADQYSVLLATDRVTFRRHDGDIETCMEVTVVPEDAAEVRRITVTNNSDDDHEIELTSYGEIVLAPPDADRAHPAFSNLFVETEWHEWCTAVTASRRPRSATERQLWCVHVVDMGRDRLGKPTCETDRARFIGRGRTKRDPIALEHDGDLEGTTGAVLDPVFAIRTRVYLDPGKSVSVAFTTLVATSRERAFELADRYHDSHASQRALDLAWARAQAELRELNVAPPDTAVFQDIAGHLFFAEPSVRPSARELLDNKGSRTLLWSQGISGEWPILLASVESSSGLPTVRQLLTAHRYWRQRGMTVDLVLLNTRSTGYMQELSDEITAIVLTSAESGVMDRPGGVFVRRSEAMPPEELLMLRATARVHVECDGRSLGELIGTREAGSGTRQAASGRRYADGAVLETDASLERPTASRMPHAASRLPALSMDNGLGGLDASGDYIIRCAGDSIPPAPWCNVIANEHGGVLVSERGGGCTWTENSIFHRLTPWHNDPVSDQPGDIIYIRDERTGETWSATPAPVRSNLPFAIRHAPGRTTFEHARAGIESLLTLGMPEVAPVKISVLRVTNRAATERSLSITAYAEWTLGVLREHTQHQVVTEFSGELHAMLARNFFEPRFAGYVSYCALSEPISSYTGDRREFVGRNGGLDAPAGLERERLSGATGAGLDPCAALQCVVDLAPGETRDVVVLLGAAENGDRAREAISRFLDPSRARGALDRSADAWRQRLSTITVSTPEPSFDVMVNRWLLYQALGCRVWGRSALYQSSGAYGFRDQLQDVMSLVYAEPALARAQILRSASRQFVEGDVQHWWHPHSGHGIRTRFSDDLAWLPFATDHYVRVTGDDAVLAEEIPFLTMRELKPDEHEVYDLPEVTDKRASLYEHCVRALGRACTSGPHALPLFGSGDWNDGMNRVGIEGRGESVWLAWFLIANLRAFAVHADANADSMVAAELGKRADDYARAIEEWAWDGAWYRRAYFDDGTPLGSAENEECRIDSIAQSWSVISGAGQPERQTQAMQSLEEHLVREDARLLMLLTPPFDRTAHDPGYIKGYLPGVRENGAQYTHAALWAVLATAMLGDGDRAFELFQMINPLTHARTRGEVATYKVEPYVVAADVYTAAGHLGRGGWTWYTGSAAWMYRVAVESILGFKKTGDTLVIDPRIPAAWPSYRIEYRFGSSMYAIEVRSAGSGGKDEPEVLVDGSVVKGNVIPLKDDALRHEVFVLLGPKKQAESENLGR